MREGLAVSESDTRVDLFAALQELSEVIPEMRSGQLMAAVGELCADLHGRGLWDADDAELLEAAWLPSQLRGGCHPQPSRRLTNGCSGPGPPRGFAVTRTGGRGGPPNLIGRPTVPGTGSCVRSTPRLRSDGVEIGRCRSVTGGSILGRSGSAGLTHAELKRIAARDGGRAEADRAIR
jgi:hypothetical protein